MHNAHQPSERQSCSESQSNSDCKSKQEKHGQQGAFLVKQEVMWAWKRKNQQMHRAQLNIQKMESENLHYDDLDVIAEGYGVIGHLSSTKEDRLVKKYLDGKVPFLPPVVTMFEINQLLKSMLFGLWI